MSTINVISIIVNNRCEAANEVQQVLTKYGDRILSRLGLHDPEEDTNIITVITKADEKYVSEFSKELSNFDGVRINKMKL